jgi:thiol:disulfide interchange protein DsbD
MMRASYFKMRMFMMTQRLTQRMLWLSAVILAAVISIAPALRAQFDLPGEVSEEEQYAHVNSVFSVTSAEAGKTYDAATIVKITPDWHINSSEPYEEWLIPTHLVVDTTPELTPSGISYPAAVEVLLAGDKMSVYRDSVAIPFKVAVAADAKPGDYTLPVHFTYQPCNDRECRGPQTVDADLQVTVGEEGTPLYPEVFASVSGAPPKAAKTTEAAAATQDNDLQRLIADHGFWGYILALGLAFITGVLLSFSPCTYPMIPITVSIFAGQDRSVGRGFILSLFYVGSMAVMYGIMGLIVSLVGGVFGAWLASTPVVIGIAVVFVIFSLSMFGLYELQVPNALRQKLGTRASGGGVIGSIVLGIVAALVVSPCVGPFVAGILLYVATSGSPLLGFFVLFVFALGLGTLYVIIATFSSAIKSLPGAGGWMESIRKFFGFVLLLMAVYFLRTIIPPSVTAAVTGLILLAFGVFGGGLDRLTSDTPFFPRLKKFLGVISLLVGTYLFVGTLLSQGLILPPASNWLPSTGPAVTEKNNQGIPWETDLEAGLARARREGKPVLIDTWATWCANCRVLEKKTFGHPDVAREAKLFVPIRVQLETSGSDAARDFMSRFNMKQYSLPTVLLLDANGNVKRIIQGVVEPEKMISEMQGVL